MRKTIIAIATLLSVTNVFADEFTITDFELSANETKTVNIALTNSQDVFGYQFSLFLPEGVSIVQGKWGHDILSSFNGNIEAVYHSEDNHYEIGFAGSRPIETGGSNQTVCTVQIVASDEVSTGLVSCAIRNQKITITEDGGETYKTIDVGESTGTTFGVTLQIDAKIGKGGYGSFSWPRDVDFSNTGVEVYVGTSYNNGWLHLGSVDDKKVPAGTGVMLKGKANETVHPQTTSAVVPALTLTNLLTGTATEAVPSDGTLYALATKTAGTGLYKVAQDVVIPKYKAYLSLGGSEGGAREAVFFGSETDGIQAVDVDASSAVAYDLQGRRVDSLAKGIYVKDGRKIIVK